MKNHLATAGVSLGLLLAGCSRSLTITTVSEYGGGPIAGVRIQVDDGEWLVTDGDGRVVLEEVPVGFDLKVHQTTTGQGFRADDFWSLEEPGWNPVVLVDGSRVPLRGSDVSGTVSGGTGGPIEVFVSRGWARQGMPGDTASGNGNFGTYVQWEGSGPLSAVVRALESDGSNPPAHFRGYGETAVTLTDPSGGGGNLTGVQVQLQPVGEMTVTGSVTVPASIPNVRVRTTSSLRLSNGEGTALAFSSGGGAPALSAVFPQVPGMVPWLSVSADEMGNQFSASSFEARAVGPGTLPVVFDLPEPAEQLEPSAGARIDESTVFRWRGGPDGGRFAVNVSCEWIDDDGLYRNANYRVMETRERELPFSAFPGLTIDSGTYCLWVVMWSPIGFHRGATQAESNATWDRYSISRSRGAIIQ